MARMFFVLFNTNRQVALHIDAMFDIMAAIRISMGIEMYKIFDGASHFAKFDVYCACICANYRPSAKVLTSRFPIDICGETLLIYC